MQANIFVISFVFSSPFATNTPVSTVNTTQSTYKSNNCIVLNVHGDNTIENDLQKSIKEFSAKCSNLVNNEYNTDSERSGFSVSTELTRNLSKLDQLYTLTLQSSTNNIKFSSEFTEFIAKQLYYLKYQPEIFPNFSGNIQLEYEDDNGYLEIEITPEFKMNIFKIKNGEEFENEDYFDFNIAEINRELDKFYES